MAERLTADEARAFLQRLAEQSWLRGTERRWWPRFAFHYTDIRNAVSILQDGQLYSRIQAKQRGKMAVSNGSSEGLAGTDVNVLDCVRFYFRPKTPTQFWAEGVHSQSSLGQSRFPDAHLWRDVLVDVCAALAAQHGAAFAGAAFTVKGRTRQYVAPRPDGMIAPAQIPGTELWVEAKWTSSRRPTTSGTSSSTTPSGKRTRGASI